MPAAISWGSSIRKRHAITSSSVTVMRPWWLPDAATVSSGALVGLGALVPRRVTRAYRSTVVSVPIGSEVGFAVSELE